MTMTSSKKTKLQQDLEAYLLVFDSESSIPQEIKNKLKEYVNAYVNIVNTPTVLDLLTLSDNIDKLASSITDQTTLLELKVFQDAIPLELQVLGASPRNIILSNESTYPVDKLGITYSSLLNDLKIALAESQNINTVDNFANTIFYTINALNPHLAVSQLKSDIQATVNTGMDLSVLANNILTSLNSINTATASTISNALYQNIFSQEQEKLYKDIVATAKLYNLNQVKIALKDACSSEMNNEEFATALYNSMLGLSSPKLSLEELKKAVNAGVANVGSVATLQNNILTNLNKIESLLTTTELLKDAVFFDNGLIPSESNDLTLDLLPANILLGFQHLKSALTSVMTNFQGGTANDLANAIKVAITNAGGGSSLLKTELANDIAASVNTSGNINNLVSNIKHALDNLDSNNLTAVALTNALYGNNLIVPGHKKNFFDDLVAKQIQMNYKDTVSSMHTDIQSANTITDLVNSIYDNLAGSSHHLKLEKLTRDIKVTVNTESLDSLKNNLLTGLDSLKNRDVLDETNIVSTLYGTNTIRASDLTDMIEDINAAETALDYKALIISLLNVCSFTQGDEPVINTTNGFARELVSVVEEFATPKITVSTASDAIASAMDSAITNNFYGHNSLKSLGLAIKDELQALLNNQIYTADAINAVIFGVVDPSNDIRLLNDAMKTENLKTLSKVKTGLVGLCERVGGSDPSPQACAQEIINTVKNGNDFTPKLDQAALAQDIEATIAQGTLVQGQPSMFQSLMYNVTSNLQTIKVNSMDATSIQHALYNSENGLISAVPYLLEKDLIQANILKNIHRIKESLINYLTTINTPATDVTSINMARGMIDAINISSGTVSSKLTDVQLSADISYTISQNENAFGTGNYNLANALITALESASGSASSIESAIFSESTILKVSQSCVANPLNQDDDTQLLDYINAVSSVANSNNLIITDIIANLQNLSSLTDYTALDLASAIVNAIVVTGNKSLTAALLQTNIDATSSSLNDLVSNLINVLEPLASSSTTDLHAIKAAFFAAMSDSGVLASSKLNADNLVNDINTAIFNTDNYAEIIAQIINNLSGDKSSLNNADVWADFVANAIVNGVQLIANGSNGSLLDRFLEPAYVKSDILFTNATALGIESLSEALVTRLSELAGSNISSTGIQNAIYSSESIVLNQVTRVINDYSLDLETAAASHSSFPEIKATFNTKLNSYAGTTANTLASDILTSVESMSGINLVTSVNQLKGNIEITMTTDAISIPNLASNIRTSMSVADINDVSVAGANMANAIFGNNIMPSYDTDLLNQDLLANQLSRASSFYELIVNNYSTSFNENNNNNYSTRDKFASLLFNTLSASNPAWTLERITQDVYASAQSDAAINGNEHSIVENLKNALTGIQVYNAENIMNALYNRDVLVETDANKQAVQADLGVSITVYGGENGLAARVKQSLDNLSASYTKENVATAIIESITPTSVNPTPELSDQDLSYDIDFTIKYQNRDLKEVVTGLKANLQALINNASATSTDLNNAIYNSINGIVASNRDEVNFELDLKASRDYYNNYNQIKANLSSIDNSTVSNAVSDILSKLPLPNNDLTQDSLTTTFNANLLENEVGTLVSQINTNVQNVNVLELTTAPMNLVIAFYPPLKPVSLFNLGLDLVVATEIDDAVSFASAIGTKGVCTNGASYTVYSCTRSKGVTSVTGVIATNDCSISGAVNAKRDCDTWATQQIDHYVSYDGVNCSDYLPSHNAAIACSSGLDLVMS